MDLDTHEVIDMIPSREISAVAQRLALFGEAEMVSRDGSILYREAICAAFPGREVEQISDRFHIVKNGTEALLQCLRRAIPGRVAVETVETPMAQRALFKDRAEKAVKAYRSGAKKPAVCREFAIAPKALERLAAMGDEEFRDWFTPKRDRLAESRRKAKKELVEKVLSLRAKGMSIRGIARSEGLAKGTVVKYLKPGAAEWAGSAKSARSRSSIDAYEERLRPMIEGGSKVSEIFREAMRLGYKGAYSNLRRYVTARRRTGSLTVTKTLGYKEVSGLLFFRRDAEKITRRHLEKLF